MDTKRILYVQHSSALGGASWCLLEMIRLLNRTRYEPHVLLREEGDLSHALGGLDCPYYLDRRVRGQHQSYLSYLGRADWPVRLPFIVAREQLRFWRLARAVQERCLQVKPNIVHINTSSLYPAALGSKWGGVPRVVLHNREHWSRHGWHPLREATRRWAIGGYVDRMLSITETGRSCLGFPRKTWIARDWPSFDPRGKERLLRKELDLGESTRLVLVPGGKASYKGSIIAMRAWNRVSVGDAAILFLGYDDSDLDGAEMSVIEGRRRSAVRCLPFTLDIRSIMQQCQVVLCPFTLPHAAKPVLEAASLGIPSIASEGGEAREYVENEKTGLLVKPGDHLALARAIDALISDPKKARAFGTLAMAKVQREFTAHASMATVYKAYDEQVG